MPTSSVRRESWWRWRNSYGRSACVRRGPCLCLAPTNPETHTRSATCSGQCHGRELAAPKPSAPEPSAHASAQKGFAAQCIKETSSATRRPDDASPPHLAWVIQASRRVRRMPRAMATTQGNSAGRALPFAPRHEPLRNVPRACALRGQAPIAPRHARTRPKAKTAKRGRGPPPGYSAKNAT